MARTKGSVNASTMVKFLVAKGKDKEYLESLPRDKLKAIYEQATAKVEEPAAAVAPVVAPKPQPVVVRERIPQGEAQPIYEACMTAIRKLHATYDLDGEYELPERITDYPLRIYAATSVREAHEIAERARDKCFTHLMFLVGEGKITGSGQQRFNEKRAKKAESLAKWLESQGKLENAAQQRARAAEIRAKMAEMKQGAVNEQ